MTQLCEKYFTLSTTNSDDYDLNQTPVMVWCSFSPSSWSQRLSEFLRRATVHIETYNPELVHLRLILYQFCIGDDRNRA
jgi:hypothetical protein